MSVKTLEMREISGTQYFYSFSGLSTDDKPTGDKIATGSEFVEVDTLDVYFWDEDGEQWLKVGGDNTSPDSEETT